MAEPLSIVGTTAGLLSLGIQVYCGIKDYLDAIQSRDEDLEKVRRHASLFKDSLEAIEKGLQSTAVHHQPSVPSVVFCLQSCEAELNSLKNILVEVGCCPSPSPSVSLRATIREGKKKLVYPFRRSIIVKLEDRLRSINAILQTAIQSLGINILSEVHDMVLDHKEKSDVLMEGISVLQSDTTRMSVSVSSIQQSLPAVMEGVQDLGPLIKAQISTVSDRVNQDQLIVQHKLSSIEDRVETLSSYQRLVLERIESHLVQKQQEDARPSRVEEILAHLQLTDLSTHQPDYRSNVAVGRLIAKPNDLKMLCDEYDFGRDCFPSNNTTSAHSSRSATRTLRRKSVNCECTRYRNRKRHYISWGSLALFHDRGIAVSPCQCSAFSVPNSSREFGAMYIGSGFLLQRAVGITFLATTGAGGASINSNISFCNVVDAKKSPVVRLLSMLQDIVFIFNAFTGDLDAGDLGKLVTECCSKIRQVYQYGKAKPRDVTSAGKTILHCAASLIPALCLTRHQKALRSVKFLVKDLLNYGVPADICDSAGSTPLSAGLTFTKDPWCRLESTETYAILFDNGSNRPINDIRQARQLIGREISGGLMGLMNYSRVAAEIIECNSLGLAIVQRNTEELKRLLEVEPSLAAVSNVFGVTPAHLALNWPEGLAYLLSICGLPAKISRRPDLLFYAAKNSSLICANGSSPVLCADCSCSKPAEIVLQYTLELDRTIEFRGIIEFASHRTRLRVLEHLKHSRERLRSYALDHLKNGDSVRLGLFSDQLLDARTEDVIDILQKMSLNIPKGFLSGIGQPASAGTVFTSSWTSVYMYIDCPVTADLAFELGFGDVDVPGSDGNTPLTAARTPGYILWLIEHGSSLLTPSQHYLGTKLNQIAAHGAAYRFGESLFRLRADYVYSWAEDHPESATRLFSLLSEVHASDVCDCACSIQGCTIFVSILKAVMWEFHTLDSGETGRWLEKIRKNFCRMLEILDLETLPLIGLRELLRYMTFLALDIRHTCCHSFCKLRGPKTRFGTQFIHDAFDEEDLQELGDEDEPLKEILENLLVEFQVSYDAGTWNLPKFLSHTWEPRMREVLEELDGSHVSEEQKTQLQNMGVVLRQGPEPAPRVVREVEIKRDLDFWLRKMDEIMQE